MNQSDSFSHCTCGFLTYIAFLKAFFFCVVQKLQMFSDLERKQLSRLKND